MKITVIGAAGRLGQRVVEEATRRGHQVTGLARHPERLARPNLLTGIAAGDGRDRDVVSGAVAGADAVVITVAGGTRKDPHQAADVTRAVTTAMRDHGVHRLVITSAYPIVGTRPRAAMWLLRKVLATPYADAAEAEQIATASGLDWTIARLNRLTDQAPRRPPARLNRPAGPGHRPVPRRRRHVAGRPRRNPQPRPPSPQHPRPRQGRIETVSRRPARERPGHVPPKAVTVNSSPAGDSGLTAAPIGRIPDQASGAQEASMSFQAYLDGVEANTGKTPQQLVDEAAAKGLTQHGEILAWLKEDYGLGTGHARAMAHVIVHGPEFELKHTSGTHRDESGTLRLDGKAKRGK